jgi:hypothetical protein
MAGGKNREAGPGKQKWIEREFENWLVGESALPDGEPLILLARQRALRRVVDLLFLDYRGGLVLVEVKNETSSRTVIGQALEYLSQYEGAQLESVVDDLQVDGERADDLTNAIADAGITEITAKRRVYIAAPSFDFATQACASLLSDRLATADLYLGLIRISRTRRGFSTQLVTPEKPRAIAQLKGECGLNPRGRLFFVLPSGPSNLVVSLGRVVGTKLNRPKGATATQRLVRQRTGSLIPYEGKYSPDLRDFGDVWRHRTQPRHAIVLARVRDPDVPRGQLVYFVLEENGRVIGYRIRTAAEFRKRHRRAPASDLDWTVLLQDALGR